jgi:hypothetical protein
MAIQYTPPPGPGPVIATDVFNPVNVDSFLKPDKILASLEAKLRKATGNEAAAIQKQIDARRAELTAEYGSVGFGSGGYVTPGYAYSEESGPQSADLLTKQKAVQAALAGKMQLLPTGSTYNDPVTGSSINLNPIYQAQYYGPQGQTGFVKDPETGELIDQYAYGQKVTMAQLAGKMPTGSNLKTFYDENGNQLSAGAVAKTVQGASFARKGWDIGFGPGMIAPGVSAKDMSDDQFRGSIVNNLVASGEMAVAGYNPVTGQITPTASTSTSTTTANLSTGTTGNPFAPGSDAAKAWNERKSAYDLLYSEFDRYGLGSLVSPLKDLITSNVSPSEFTLRLRETDAYKNRFAANQARVKNGLRALSEAEYIRNEDAYQEVMRRRGLPVSYYEQTVDPVTGITKQKGFESLLAGDVSSTELEDRIVTAQDRVLNANPEIAKTLKEFYPGISNGDILAYVLDPSNAINVIKRKIMTAEIGTAAKAEGLTSGLSRAEELATMGITGETARQGYRTIADVVPRASQLADIYGQNPYTQQTAETEVFGLAGSNEAARQRKKLTQLETAAFSGSAGAGAIARDRAGVL